MGHSDIIYNIFFNYFYKLFCKTLSHFNTSKRIYYSDSTSGLSKAQLT